MSTAGRRSIAWIACLGLWLAPFGASALSIQLFAPSVIQGANVSAIPATGSIPTTGTFPGNSSYTGYDLSTSAFLFTFDTDAQAALDYGVRGDGRSSATLTFSLSQDVPYSVTGMFVYGTAVAGEDVGIFQESLVDVTPGSPGSVVYSTYSTSYQSPLIAGNPIGTLQAGRQYQLSYSAEVSTGMNGVISMTGTGNVGLYFTPEPSSLSYMCCGLSAVVLSRRRRARS